MTKEEFRRFAKHIKQTGYTTDVQAPNTSKINFNADIRCNGCNEYTLAIIDAGEHHLNITYPDNKNHKDGCVVALAEKVVKDTEVSHEPNH